ncbi:hypothetical protein B296_00052981 [Ensete ventricosum]|uniref:Uncharacterized protein n=1 Tax=Ensete ventricosum TaxID=4639 RepID=A0A426WZS7_ENSVE|nr:hypothetical protein B296_00052981 [Ensete ventricosum]
MHPLKFPNSCIRAKRRQRGGGAASHGQPSCKAGHPWPGCDQGPLQGGGRLRPGLARKGGQLRSRGQQLPIGTPTCSMAPAKGPVAGRPQGAVDRRGGRPLAGWLPTGKGSRRLHRGSSGDDTDGARGVRASF